MIKISVIIPYYQRETGILRRALQSILNQSGLPDNACIDIILIDDGSPISAESEIFDLEFNLPFSLKLIKQVNSGVAAARNAGLRNADSSTTYIAFLDSDDSWYPEHLSQGIAALEKGYDFYFCDHHRPGHHESNFLASKPMSAYLSQAAVSNFPEKIDLTSLQSIVLTDCVTQASTTIFRRSMAPDLLFDISLMSAGEDLVFFTELVHKSRHPCFSRKVNVICGQGVNIYFSNLGWDSLGNLNRVINNFRARVFIDKNIRLSHNDRSWNKTNLAAFRRDIVFLSLRQIFRNKGRMPPELRSLAKDIRFFPIWYIALALQICVYKCFGKYKPL